jgi:hypothetical protein
MAIVKLLLAANDVKVDSQDRYITIDNFKGAVSRESWRDETVVLALTANRYRF